MDDLDYLKRDSKFDWTHFADRVIPFITDNNAKRLVRQEQRKFGMSKVLKSLRQESGPLLRAELENAVFSEGEKNGNQAKLKLKFSSSKLRQTFKEKSIKLLLMHL